MPAYALQVHLQIPRRARHLSEKEHKEGEQVILKDVATLVASGYVQESCILEGHAHTSAAVALMLLTAVRQATDDVPAK